MLSEKQIIALAESIYSKFGAQHVEKLSSESNWDIKSCRWFIWKLKSLIKTFLISSTGSIQLMNFSEFGVSRFAPLGSKRQLKKMDKIMAEMGEFSEDKEYEDIADEYIAYIAYSLVSYYMQGEPHLLNGFVNSQQFITTLKGYTDILFNEGGDGQEEDDEEVWDPYSLQKWILEKIKQQNDEITKENKESEEENKKLKVIPKDFDILKDREKISPV